MARRQPYTLSFAAEVIDHLRAMDPKYYAMIQAKLGDQVRLEPLEETIHRKPIWHPAPLGATWEVRFGPDKRFRMLYDVDEEAREVKIMALQRAIMEPVRQQQFRVGEWLSEKEFWSRFEQGLPVKVDKPSKTPAQAKKKAPPKKKSAASGRSRKK